MRIISHPRLPEMWSYTYECGCGGVLEATIQDVKAGGMHTNPVYYLECPICIREHRLNLLPPPVKRIIDSL
jgi:hypothetical protein